MLKPDTISDSPSVKSKGVRLVSAREEINQIKAKGTDNNPNHTPLNSINILNLRLEDKTTNLSKIIENLTS